MRQTTPLYDPPDSPPGHCFIGKKWNIRKFGALSRFVLLYYHDRRRKWQPTPILLPGKSRGQRSLVDYSPRGREDLGTTEQLHFHFSLSRTGEGNGNLLQCSCLENPRDRGAWWAAVCGFAQSWTRLMRLGGSSSRSTTTISDYKHLCPLLISFFIQSFIYWYFNNQAAQLFPSTAQFLTWTNSDFLTDPTKETVHQKNNGCFTQPRKTVEITGTRVNYRI